MKIFNRKPAQEKMPSGGGSESGVSGDSVFSVFDREVERKDKCTIQTYRKMRDSDGTVDALYNIITRPILAATYSIKADSEDENGEQAEFIRQSLCNPPYKGGMETPFSLVLEQMLKSIMDGFEVFERVYTYNEQNGRLTLKKLALRDATTVKLKIDSHGGYDGIRQQASFGGKMVDIKLPAEKTFLITYGKADDLLYGRSAFKSIYANWDKKRKIEYLDSISIQNSAIRPKVLQRISNAMVNSSSDNDDGSRILKVLSRLGHLKPVAKIPYGYEVKELEGGNNSGTHEAIERQNSEMARSFLASFIMLGTQGKSSSGSYSLSSDQSDLFMLSLKGVMNLIAEHINQYWIADLIDLNFPYDERHYPEFCFDSFTDEATEFIKTIFSKLIEKDQISTGMAKSIEEMVASRFEIEIPEEDKQNQSVDGDVSNINTGAGIEASDTKDIEEDEQEGDGANATKFFRALTEFEEKINWDSIARQDEKIADEFAKKATPILERYINEIAENPSEEVVLPKEYVKLLTETYRKSYNYGKLSASDEENQKAPKTKEAETINTQRFVDFVINKQTSDIKNLILEQEMNAPTTIEEELNDGWTLKAAIVVAGLRWVMKAVDGTKTSIFGRGMNDGRNDAFAVFDQQQEAVYMWSALLENSCDLCRKLDGSVLSSQEKAKSKYQPGKLHLGDRCIWVRVTGKNKPKITGLPDDIEEIDHLTNTPKAQLQKEGSIGKNETKVNALRRKTMSNTDNGKTLSAVEDAIRGQDFETMAAFDDKGKKLFEWTDNMPRSVSPPHGWAKFFKDNNGAVITHNHPSGSSFSKQDLVTAAGNNLPELRIASKTFDYSIKAPNGWPDADELMEFAIRQEAMFSNQAEQMITEGKLSKTEKESWIIEKKTVAVAEKFDLEYNKTERK